MVMFDTEKLRKKCGLSEEQFAFIERQVQEEFKDDEMMYELHLLRILEAIEHHWISAEELVTEAGEG